MRKLRWGLIGCGDIAHKRVAPALRDLGNCELVAVSRADYIKAHSFAREYGATRYYADWKDLVADPDIEAIYIATPVYLHAKQTIMAAEYGKHVLCEKPMALNATECDKMIAACSTNKVKLTIAYYRHFYPVLNRIKELIRGGSIGEISLIQMNAFEFFDHKPGEPRYWLLQKEFSGGGPMMDFGCHRIEVMLNLFGPVKEVRSVTSAHLLQQRDVEDTVVAIMQFVNGAMGVLSVTHASQVRKDTLDIYATRGMLSVPVLNDGTLIILNADGERIEKYPPHTNLHLPLVENFTAAVLDDSKPVVTGEHGREVSLILDAIYERSTTMDI